MEIFGIGFGEMLLLMVLALMVVGPDKLPEMARKAGKAVAVFKAQTDEMRGMLSLDTPGPTTVRTASDTSAIQQPVVYDGKNGSNPFDLIKPVQPVQIAEPDVLDTGNSVPVSLQPEGMDHDLTAPVTTLTSITSVKPIATVAIAD